MRMTISGHPACEVGVGGGGDDGAQRMMGMLNAQTVFCHASHTIRAKLD